MAVSFFRRITRKAAQSSRVCSPSPVSGWGWLRPSTGSRIFPFSFSGEGNWQFVCLGVQRNKQIREARIIDQESTAGTQADVVLSFELTRAWSNIHLRLMARQPGIDDLFWSENDLLFLVPVSRVWKNSSREIQDSWWIWMIKCWHHMLWYQVNGFREFSKYGQGIILRIWEISFGS